MASDTNDDVAVVPIQDTHLIFNSRQLDRPLFAKSIHNNHRRPSCTARRRSHQHSKPIGSNCILFSAETQPQWQSQHQQKYHHQQDHNFNRVPLLSEPRPQQHPPKAQPLPSKHKRRAAIASYRRRRWTTVATIIHYHQLHLPHPSHHSRRQSTYPTSTKHIHKSPRAIYLHRTYFKLPFTWYSVLLTTIVICLLAVAPPTTMASIGHTQYQHQISSFHTDTLSDYNAIYENGEDGENSNNTPKWPYPRSYPKFPKTPPTVQPPRLNGFIPASLSCPNCIYNIAAAAADAARKVNPSDAEPLPPTPEVDHIPKLIGINAMRLEAIKYQILTKLGLETKPNISNHLPKQVVLDTLSRAEQSSATVRQMVLDETTGEMHQHTQNALADESKNNYAMAMEEYSVNDTRQSDSYYAYSSSSRSSVDNMGGDNEEVKMFAKHTDYEKTSDKKNPNSDKQTEDDDFFGQTREIIMFAEKGE